MEESCSGACDEQCHNCVEQLKLFERFERFFVCLNLIGCPENLSKFTAYFFAVTMNFDVPEIDLKNVHEYVTLYCDPKNKFSRAVEKSKPDVLEIINSEYEQFLSTLAGDVQVPDGIIIDPLLFKFLEDIHQQGLDLNTFWLEYLDCNLAIFYFNEQKFELCVRTESSLDSFICGVLANGKQNTEAIHVTDQFWVSLLDGIRKKGWFFFKERAYQRAIPFRPKKESFEFFEQKEKTALENWSLKWDQQKLLRHKYDYICWLLEAKKTF